MQLIRYNPARELLGTDKGLDRLLTGDWPLMPLFTEDSTVDLYVEDGKLVAEIGLANFKKEEIRITADGDGLEIMAEHQETEEKNVKRNYLLRESSRAYRRRVSLPPGADTRNIKASFKDGKLIVAMPIAHETETREVVIT